LSPRLGQHISEPYVEVHADDAKVACVDEGSFARVTTAFGTCVLKVRVSPGQQRGSIFAPIHWNDQTASFARVGALAAPFTDPYSGQPEMKATPASLAPVQLHQRGFVLSRSMTLDLPEGAVWARVAVEQGTGYKIASDDGASLWCDWLRAQQGDCDLIEYSDPANDGYRAALLRDGRIELCVFIAAGPAALSWDTVAALFSAATLDDQQRRMLLSGKSASGSSDGPIVCACYGVGRNRIAGVLESGEACSVAEIGATLRAGTNCGSCIPELKRMVAAQAAAPKKMDAAE
jgi:assimilatory nitrate reductase catalytic subunit